MAVVANALAVDAEGVVVAATVAKRRLAKGARHETRGMTVRDILAVLYLT